VVPGPLPAGMNRAQLDPGWPSSAALDLEDPALFRPCLQGSGHVPSGTLMTNHTCYSSSQAWPHTLFISLTTFTGGPFGTETAHSQEKEKPMLATLPIRMLADHRHHE
jgi:hypothetical protein